MTVFNKSLIKTKDNLKALETTTATIYNKNGAFTLQGLSVNTSQSVSNFTKLNNAFNAYNGNLSKSTQLQNAYIQAVGNQNHSLGNYLAGLNGAKASMGGYIKSLVGAKAATIGLQVASTALNAAISMGLSLAISALISAITSWVNKEKEAREAAIETAQAAKEESNNLSELLGKYNQLSKEVKTNSGVKEDLLSVQSDLLEALGIEASQIDTLIEKYGDLDTAINQVTLDSLRKAQADLMGAVDAYEEELLDEGADGFWGGNNIINATGDSSVKAFEALEKAGVVDRGSYGSGGGAFVLIGDDTTVDGILQNYQKLKDAQEALNTAVDDGTFTMEEMTENPLYKAINARLKEIESAVENYNTSVDDLNKNIVQQQILTSVADMDTLPETQEEFETFKQSMIDTAVASTKFIGSQEDIKDSIINVLSTMPEFEKFFEDIKVKSETFSDRIPDLFSQLTDSKDSINTFTSSVKSAYEAYETLLNPNVSSSDILSSIQSITEAVSAMGGSLNWEFIDGNNNSLELLGNAIESVSEKYANSVLSGMGVDTNSEFGQMLANNIIQAQKAETAINNVTQSIGSLQSAYNSLTDIVLSYNEVGYLNLDQLQILLELEPQYLSCLIDEEGQLAINQQSMLMLANQRLNDAEAQAVQQAVSELGQLALQDEKVAIEENANAFTNAISDIEDYNSKLAETILTTSLTASHVRDLSAALGSATANGASDEQINTVLNNLDTKLKMINSTRSGLSKSLGSFDKIISGGSGSSSASKSAKKEFEETVDLFEERIEELNNALDLLKANLENVVGSFTKNTLIDAQIGINKESINNYSDALDMYTEKANEALSKLPSDIAEKVQNGAIAINDFVGDGNEEVVNAIKEYDKWADKMHECQLAIAELHQELEDLELQKFTNVMEDFNNQFDIRENSKDLLDKQIDLFKEAGLLVGESFYSAQIDQSKKQLELLEQEKAKLVEQMNSALASGRVKLCPAT